ncbi:putative tonB-dependent receptor [Neisseria gonorrhoeae]|nr:putative tonB-dependent receptor [Neisseria gonorrhoeae]
MNSLAGAGWNVGGTLVADKVKDLIIFDRAHGQSGTASKDGGIITRNVDARLFTAQAYARYNFNPHWAAASKPPTTTDTTKPTAGRPIKSVRLKPPSKPTTKNYFAHGSYNIGAATRFVAKQTRGDFDMASGSGHRQTRSRQRLYRCRRVRRRKHQRQIRLALGREQRIQQKIRRIHQRRPRPRPIPQRSVCTGQDILVEFACGILKPCRLKNTCIGLLRIRR